MTSINFELDAEVRADIGKGASRRLRHTDKIPAVVYGGGEPAVSLTLDHKKTMLALSHEAFYSHILTLNINKKSEKVILKAVQRNPAKPRLHHIDFLRIRADQKLTMHIPLHFLGGENCPGVAEGGVISHIMSDVEVSCLPANLPEFLEVDLTSLALNQTVHLSDIKLPKGVDLVAFAHGVEEHDLPIASVHIPRIIEEEVIEAAPEESAEAVEGEGEVKAEEAGKTETKDKE